jgi:hypothetical protein
MERHDGQCECGVPVVKSTECAGWTLRTDKTMYQYRDEPASGYDIFRCSACGAVIDEVWRPTPEATGRDE